MSTSRFERERVHRCLACNAPIPRKPGRRAATFCSPACKGKDRWKGTYTVCPRCDRRACGYTNPFDTERNTPCPST